MSDDARVYNTETRAVISFTFLQGKAPKETYTILTETVGGVYLRMPPTKTGWSSLNVVIFPPVIRLVLDDPKW
jgi:hypothetical protein